MQQSGPFQEEFNNQNGAETRDGVLTQVIIEELIKRAQGRGDDLAKISLPDGKTLAQKAAVAGRINEAMHEIIYSAYRTAIEYDLIYLDRKSPEGYAAYRAKEAAQDEDDARIAASIKINDDANKAKENKEA